MTFPGHIFDADGRNIGGTALSLRQDQLDACPHRSMVSDCDVPALARVWLLNDDATPGAISSVIMDEAVRLVLTGRGILILARRPEPEVDVRTGLMEALDLFMAPVEVSA